MSAPLLRSRRDVADRGRDLLDRSADTLPVRTSHSFTRPLHRISCAAVLGRVLAPTTVPTEGG